MIGREIQLLGIPEHLTPSLHHTHQIPAPIDLRISQLAKLRETLLIANSVWQLRELSYQVDEFLTKYPNEVEGKLLKDQVQAAMRYESPTPGFSSPSNPTGLPQAREAKSPERPGALALVIRTLSFGALGLLIALVIHWLLTR